jgi:signal transduction histidine kinase
MKTSLPQRNVLSAWFQQRSHLYPIFGSLLGLGAPIGAIVLRLLWKGGNVLQSFEEELAAHSFHYGYMTLGTVSALALYAYLVGRRDDRLVASLKERTEQLEKNVRELQRVQKQLVEKERFAALGLLSASVVHELSSPLDGALDVANLIEKAERVDVVRNEFCPVLRDCLLKIDRLIKKLRFLSRSYVDEPQEQIDLGHLLREILQVQARRCQKACIEVRTAGLDQSIPFLAYQEKLHHAFMNLIVNAIEAMPEGGTLTVCVSTDPQGVVVRICDTGVGIPKENLDHLFTPFRSTKPTGMGLGLTIAASIIREHQGNIKIDSRVNRGTTVKVFLPYGSSS